MIISVHQPQYIPWLGFFDKIAKSDAFVFLDQVQYKPREFQNRNKIRTKDTWMWLTVPVVSKDRSRQKICDVLIDNAFPWRRKHPLSLKSCYGSTAFFKDYFPFLEETYAKEWEKLVDLNVHMINFILKQLSISRPIYFASGLGLAGKSTGLIIEICRRLKANTYLSGIGGKAYLAEEKFAEAGIKLIYQDFIYPAYQQQAMKDEHDFIPYMSTLDLLFNEGQKAREILKL